MKVLFVTNIPSPYRVDFFNMLGERTELTVVFTESVEEQKHRSSRWFFDDYDHFRPVFLKKKRKIGGHAVLTDILDVLRESYDHIILGGYSSPTFMLAIGYLKMHRRPFLIEADGGIIKADPPMRRRLKRYLIGSADGWFASGELTRDYFVHYGADRDRVFLYPFSSLKRADLTAAFLLSGEGIEAASGAGLLPEQEDALRFLQQPALEAEYGSLLSGDAAAEKHFRAMRGALRAVSRRMLDIPADRPVVLYVGQFIHRKGVDVLLEAVSRDKEYYLVGGKLDGEYAKSLPDGGPNVHFLGFKTKEELRVFFRAADVFVLPTREDIWGLVVNEALSYGLPVVSTETCVAALELVEQGKNGWIVPAGNPERLAEAIEKSLTLENAPAEAVRSVADYTIEKMVQRHLEVLDGLRQ